MSDNYNLIRAIRLYQKTDVQIKVTPRDKAKQKEEEDYENPFPISEEEKEISKQNKQ